jgi:glycine/D-amino acid oxidase-like deaminating enzyme
VDFDYIIVGAGGNTVAPVTAVAWIAADLILGGDTGVPIESDRARPRLTGTGS